MNEELKDVVSKIIINNPYEKLGLTDDIALDPNADTIINNTYTRKKDSLKAKLTEITKKYGVSFTLEQLLGKEDYHIELASINKEEDTVQDVSDRRDAIEEERKNLSEMFLSLLEIRKAYSMISNEKCRNELLQKRITSNIENGLITEVNEEEIKNPRKIKLKLDSGDEVYLIEDSKLNFINFSTVNHDYIKKYRLLRNGEEESHIYLDIPSEITDDIIDIIKPLLEKEHMDKFSNKYLGNIRKTNEDGKIANKLIYDIEAVCAITINEKKKRERANNIINEATRIL